MPILFSLNTGVLALILAAVIFGATFAGLWIGRSLRDRGDTLREPLGCGTDCAPSAPAHRGTASVLTHQAA